MKDGFGFHAFNAFADARTQRLGKTLSYSGTSGALVLEAIDKEIEHIVNYKNVVRMNIPRVSAESDYYKVVQRAAGSTPGEFVAETGDFTQDNGSYTKATFGFKTLGGRGKITRFAMATGRSFSNVMTDELEGRLEDLKDYEEWATFYAKATTSNQFNGLHYLVPSTTINQHVGCTTGSGVGSLTLAKMDELWDKTRVFPDMAITSYKGRRIINTLLQTYQRFQNQTEVNGGFIVQTYNGVPILPSGRVLDVLTWNGSSVSAISGGTSSVIYTLSRDKTFIAELTPLTMMLLARVTSQYDQFDLFEDVVPVSKNDYRMALLAGFAS